MHLHFSFECDLCVDCSAHNLMIVCVAVVTHTQYHSVGGQTIAFDLQQQTV